jgi:hypothetical protein
MTSSTEEAAHNHVAAEHGPEMHAARREHGPGYALITCERGGHLLRYVTTDQHRSNVADGLVEDEVALMVGLLLAKCGDDPGQFPSVMEHGDGTWTGNIVNAVSLP